MTQKDYGGKTAEQRQAERRARLVAAGLDVLGSDGVEGASVRAVCRRAGLISRYFYESFNNLDELLVAAFDEVTAQGAARIAKAARNSDGSVRACVDSLVDGFVTLAVEDPRAMRIGYVEAWGSTALMDRRVETLHQIAAWLCDTLVRGAAPRKVDRDAVAIASSVVVGGLLQSVLGWMGGVHPVDREALVAHFTNAAVSALEQALD